MDTFFIFSIIILILIAFLIAFIMSLVIKKILKEQVENTKPISSLENIPSDFEHIYKELLANNNNTLETLRKPVQRIATFEIFSVFLFILGIALSKINVVMGILGILGLFLAIAFYNTYIQHEKKYIEEYKKEIISKFIKLLNNNLRYTPLNIDDISMQMDYKNANFENRNFDRFLADDYIEGFINEHTFLKICDLDITDTVQRGQKKHIETIFSGIFVQTKTEKNTGIFLKISSNKTNIFKSNINRVELDSKIFEELFDVYSDNKLATMQLLTSDIMEYLIDFRNNYKIKYEIVIRNNTIYMRFFTGTMFEPQIFGNALNKQLLLTYYNVSKFILDFTEKFSKVLDEAEL